MDALAEYNLVSGSNDGSFTPHRKLQILLVPDALPWITGTIAKMISYHNHDYIDATVVTGTVLQELLDRCRSLPGRIDLVHFLTHHDAESLVKHFAGRIPVVLAVHHIEGPQCTNLIPLCDAIVTPCAQWYDILDRGGVDSSKLAIAPYGVSTNQFRPAVNGEKEDIRKRFGLRPDGFVVGFCAKRSSDSSGRKGVDVLTNAVEELGRAKLDVSLLIVGPGWSDVAERARRAGIECVHLPYVSGEASFAEIYRILDVYWVTSRIEGGPVPLLEAMSSGVCCVSTRVGMALDLIQDGTNGIFVPFDDPLAIVQATVRIKNDTFVKTLIGESARRTLISGYDWKQTSQIFFPLYQRTISQFNAANPSTIITPIFDDSSKFDTAISPLDIPYLSAIPAHDREWVNAREHFCFLDMMRHSSEHDHADLRHQLYVSSLGNSNSSIGPLALAHYLKWGWISFVLNDSRRTIDFAFRALRQRPSSLEVWRLLACIVLKPLKDRLCAIL